ncbi:5797_t:CDS:2, partial [Cetraspora pellucida]
LQEAFNYNSESESSDDENESAISFYTQENQHQLYQLMNIQSPTSNEHVTSPRSKNLSSNNMFKDLIFGSAQRSQEFTDELNSYLDLR